MKYPRKKDYPKTFPLGPKGSIWRVQWRMPRDDRPWCGRCCPDTKTIELELGRTPKQTLEDFIHELIHALAFELNIPKLHHHGWIRKLEGAVAELVRLLFPLNGKP